MSSEHIRKRRYVITVITLYPKDGAKIRRKKYQRNLLGKQSDRSIRIPIGLINRSIRPMVFSFRRSKCRSNWTRVTLEVILVDNDFHLCFFFHAFLRSTRGLAASIGLHEFLSSVVPRIKFHRCINNRGADERHTESVETSFGLIRSDDTVPRCVLVSFTR